MKRVNRLDLDEISLLKSKEMNKNPLPEVPFDDFFQEALNFDKEINKAKVKGIEHNFNQKPALKLDEDVELLAQAFDANEVENIFKEVESRRKEEEQYKIQRDQEEAYELSTKRLEVTPMQLFIDKAVEVLESVSELDFKVNDLIEQYIQGKASIDEVSLEMSKLSLAVSFVTTVISNATQTFKEITQLAI